jgi:hypothetical protein
MKKLVLRFLLMGLLAVAVAGTPLALHAQMPGIPVGTNSVSNQVIPFRGKLKTVDATAKTITIGTQTIQITSETKITKMGKPATLADGAEGDMVAGAYRKDADGKLNAVSLRFGPKPLPESGQTKTNKTKTP